MIRKADFIVTHSSEGISYLNTCGRFKNIKYLPHPVRELKLVRKEEKIYDVIIWGAVSKYKGIDVFLEYLVTNNLQERYKILIAGKINNSGLELKILELIKGTGIRLINQFIDDESLDKLIYQSGLVLFTYHSDSVLSSGALIYSLSRGAFVLGPATGAFNDIEKWGLCRTYNTFDDLISLIENRLTLHSDPSDVENLQKFYDQNNWKSFAVNMQGWID